MNGVKPSNGVSAMRLRPKIQRFLAIPLLMSQVAKMWRRNGRGMCYVRGSCSVGCGVGDLGFPRLADRLGFEPWVLGLTIRLRIWIKVIWVILCNWVDFILIFGPGVTRLGLF
ncbi:hypothetical protein ES288_A05G319900v1 [Gossypium darwinii]|uniref:Uncharacterized protein n=1 Tax=Gossypium darwinii TaxID=34276 RepID=A0A5D2GNR1_GOSDA|nr:hypothetical protein ES288_A05G319900v1 [Gossypium darwinii]